MNYCHECKHYFKKNDGDAFCALSNKPAGYLHAGKPCFEPAPAEPQAAPQSADNADVIPPGMKRCSKCGRILPVTEFNKNRAMKDSLQYMCKDCDRKMAKGTKKAFRDRQRAEKLEAIRAQMEAGVKVCKCCGRTLPLDQFSPHGNALDGLQPVCKECKAEYGRKARAKRRPTPKKEETEQPKPKKVPTVKIGREVVVNRSVTIPVQLIHFIVPPVDPSMEKDLEAVAWGEITFTARKADIIGAAKLALGNTVIMTLAVQEVLEGGEK